MYIKQYNSLLQMQVNLTDLQWYKWLAETAIKDPSYYLLLVVSCSVIWLILGLLLHEKKLENALLHITDSQRIEKQLSKELKSTQESVQKVSKWSIRYKVLIIPMTVISGVQFYLGISMKVTAIICVFALGCRALISLWSVYLRRRKQSIQGKVSNMKFKVDIYSKQLLNLFGPLVSQTLRRRYEDGIDNQIREEAKTECRLMQCYDEKNNSKQVYQLAKSIITQMQTMNWCNICAERTNGEANIIKDIQNNLKVLAKIVQEQHKISIDKKQELANRLLKDWEVATKLIQTVCKRGCCIKFRTLVEKIKQTHYKKILAIKNKT